MADPAASAREHSSSVPRWIDEARSGSPEALGDLLEYCRNYLLLVANQELAANFRAKAGASDIVQETCLRAQQNFLQFRGDTETEILAWLRRILLNSLANVKRGQQTQKRAMHREIPLAVDTPSGEWRAGAVAVARAPSPSGQCITREEMWALDRALQRLPHHYRQCIELRNWERWSFAEIGESLDCSAEAARKLWTRAIDHLRSDLNT